MLNYPAEPSFRHRFSGRNLLIRILDAFTNKFAALNLNFPAALKQHQKRKISENDEDAMDTSEPSKELSSSTLTDDFDFDRSRAIHTVTFAPDSGNNYIKGELSLS